MASEVENGPRGLHAVIFDLFETLISEYTPDFRQEPSIASRLAVPEALFDEAWGDLFRDRMTGRIPDFGSALRVICERAGVSPNPRVVEEVLRERVTAKAKPFLSIEPEIAEMLLHLRSSGFKIGLVSNASSDELTAWSDSPLSKLVDQAVFSCQVGVMKPDWRIYSIVCDQLDMTPPQIAYVGDGSGRELSGAAEAGLHPFWATWFLDRWPSSQREGRIKLGAAQFPSLRSPADLVDALSFG